MPGRLSDSDVLYLMALDSPFNRARREFRKAAGRIDQASAQKIPASALELRRMEFEAVESIVAALGLQMPDGARDISEPQPVAPDTAADRE